MSRLDHVFNNNLDIDTEIYHNISFYNKLKDFKNQNNLFDNVINKHIIQLENKINELIGGKIVFDGKLNDFVFVKKMIRNII